MKLGSQARTWRLSAGVGGKGEHVERSREDGLRDVLERAFTGIELEAKSPLMTRVTLSRSSVSPLVKRLGLMT